LAIELSCFVQRDHGGALFSPSVEDISDWRPSGNPIMLSVESTDLRSNVSKKLVFFLEWDE
jgi:hypothetical protein